MVCKICQFTGNLHNYGILNFNLKKFGTKLTWYFPNNLCVFPISANIRPIYLISYFVLKILRHIRIFGISFITVLELPEIELTIQEELSPIKKNPNVVLQKYKEQVRCEI